MIKEDISNKTVLVLALLVVLVVAGSSWLILNKLNAVETASPKTVQNIEVVQEEMPEIGGSVTFSILPQPRGEQ